MPDDSSPRTPSSKLSKDKADAIAATAAKYQSSLSEVIPKTTLIFTSLSDLFCFWFVVVNTVAVEGY